MSEKKKKEPVYFYDEVETDEMQKSLSYELEHKSLWLWYILNSFAMFFSLFIFVGTENPAWAVPPSVQILLLVQYGIMYFCLSLYNIRAAKKGVLESFSRYQHGMSGLKYAVGGLNLIIPMCPIVNFIMLNVMDRSGYENVRTYLPFFTAWLIMSTVYEFVSYYCVVHNKKVRDSLAADDEETENNDN